MNRTRSRALTLTTTPLALGLALGLATALAAAPAHASSTTKKDPVGDHVTGSANLDLAKVQLRTRGKQKVRITFGLHHDVTTDDLARPGAMGVSFHTQKKRLRSVEISARDGAYEGRICTYDMREEELPPATNCSSVPVTAVDARTFRAEVRLKKVKKGAKVLRWSASAFSLASGSPAVDPLGRGFDKPFTWRL
ncbi:hypothetical protein [Nocardioides solisilvae]|uniref:hypothetical protein n=1 Tax=Nocardioides solisilvae TaxID=1542435 RepID=UPI000D74FEA8|nr:hypothetical protein [Nocardioides solisilvae]